MYFSVTVFVVCLIILAVLSIRIRAGWGTITREGYRRFRDVILLCTMIFAVITILHIASRVPIPRPVPGNFLPALLGYVLFWALLPPMWFFFEYFAHESDWITGLPDKEAELKRIKDYADFSAKIWAAVLAVLAAMVALSPT
jgi:hypothetical protein